jgi:hypothetical protein
MYVNASLSLSRCVSVTDVLWLLELTVTLYIYYSEQSVLYKQAELPRILSLLLLNLEGTGATNRPTNQPTSQSLTTVNLWHATTVNQVGQVQAICGCRHLRRHRTGRNCLHTQEVGWQPATILPLTWFVSATPSLRALQVQSVCRSQIHTCCVVLCC